MNIGRQHLQPAEVPLIGFGGKRMNALGKIPLPVFFGDLTNPWAEHVTLNVVEMNYPYISPSSTSYTCAPVILVHEHPHSQGCDSSPRQLVASYRHWEGVAPVQRIVHHVELNMKPTPFKKPTRNKEKTNSAGAKRKAHQHHYQQRVEVPNHHGIPPLSLRAGRCWRKKNGSKGVVIHKGELFKSGVTAPWLKWISIVQGRELLREVHPGLNGFHIGAKPLVVKAFRQGFFWPTTLKDGTTLSKPAKHARK